MQLSKIFSNAVNSNIVQKHIDKSILAPKYLTRTLLATSISKDVFAYALRVYNTKNNQEIPPDKRDYVMKMDAVTGVVTASVQATAGILVSNDKLQNVVTNKLFAPIADNVKAFKSAKVAFGTLSTILVATLFAKRVIVPYISSKIASSQLFSHKSKKQESPQNLA